MSTSNNTNPILAIACGPIVTSWDISKIKIESKTDRNNLDDEYYSSSYDINTVVDATSALSHSYLSPSELSASTSCASSLSSSQSHLDSIGVGQFKPFCNVVDGLDFEGSIVNDIAWNHNGQVLATCSNAKFNSSSNCAHNIALTLYTTQTKLETFSNFIPSSTTSTPQQYRTTSISFGGSNAKSRYVCVSDDGGYISVWDMKKQPVKRVRHFRLLSNNINSNHVRPSCSKACMDPTDTLIIGLHGDTPPLISSTIENTTMRNYQNVTLDLFHLKNGGIVSSLQDDGTHGGSSSCFHCSNLDSNQLLVGTRDGSLLLWDLSSSSSTKSTTDNNIAKGFNYISPVTTLEKRHGNSVTDVEFSPMNKVLAASCSLDGTIVFHDVLSKKKIQTLRPTLASNTNDVTGTRTFGLTSLAFHSNGYTWAVGTDNGYVMNYDLRQISSGPLSTMNVGNIGEIGNDNMMTSINKRKSFPISRLQFSPMQPTSKTPKTTKKKSLSSSTKATLVQEKLSPHVISEESKLASSEKERAEGQQLNSPQPPLPAVVKELFQADDSNQKIKSEILETADQKFINNSKEENLNIEKSLMLEDECQTQVLMDSTSQECSKNESFQGASSADADGMLQTFDQMYERLKNRETIHSSPQIESNDPMRKMNGESTQVLMITKKDMQEMIDDSVEALRDDMDEALQNIQCNFMRQLQKQSDETKMILENQKKVIENLLKENAALKAKNDDLRLF